MTSPPTLQSSIEPAEERRDSSDRYPVAVLIALAVALAGAALLLATEYDLTGTALLLSGDVLMIIFLVAYLRVP